MICGAGIAGLAAGLFITRAGYRVEIFEQAEVLDPIGSGLQLSPNAMRVLEELGLDRQIKAVATAPTQIDVRDGENGKPITSIPLGADIVQKYKQPYLVIHRADLQKILLSACQNEPDIQLRMAVKVRDAVRHSNGISLIADNSTGTQNYRGAALIGADGVNSIIRNECFECSNPISTGTIALRGMLPISKIPENLQNNNITMWLGTQAHVVMYPVRGGQYQNVVITLRDEFCDKFPQDLVAGHKIKSEMPMWNDDFLSLLDIDAGWTSWPLMAAPKLSDWHENNILLIGDAAHAMTPHAAQGAAMALEDAFVLGSMLSKNENIESAFEQYQKARMKRVRAVRKLSNTNKLIYQLPQILAVFRNLSMRIMGGKRLLGRQDWIYRWQPNISSKR